MISELDSVQAGPARKAELINATARAQLALPLWRAALGDGDDASGAAPDRVAPVAMGGESLFALLEQAAFSGLPAAPPATDLRNPVGVAARETVSAPQAMAVTEKGAAATNLGANSRFGGAIAAASERTGIPAQALASIIDAEAAKQPDGAWKTMSRNPRSSAAGLGQFLNRTWVDEAERDGTWLNATARERGWIGANGKISPGSRAALLALRYDGEASIQATADYALANLRYLRKQGIEVGSGAESVARTAYLAHHLGAGDAARFLGDGIKPARAEMLLTAQVGARAASTRIAQAGDAAGAHRAWLLDYVDRHVNPDRFIA